jgi:hypothetical protein
LLPPPRNPRPVESPRRCPLLRAGSLIDDEAKTGLEDAQGRTDFRGATPDLTGANVSSIQNGEDVFRLIQFNGEHLVSTYSLPRKHRPMMQA